jgi:hypothetical protein
MIRAVFNIAYIAFYFAFYFSIQLLATFIASVSDVVYIFQSPRYVKTGSILFIIITMVFGAYITKGTQFDSTGYTICIYICYYSMQAIGLLYEYFS